MSRGCCRAAVPALRWGRLGGLPPSACPCLAAQVGGAGKSGAQVDGNSSLVLRPLVKEQHGLWECTATNQVASVSTTTSVHVLGELPVPGGQASSGGAGLPWGGQYQAGGVERPLRGCCPSRLVRLVFLLLPLPGTSPHAVTNVSVLPLLLAANISWEPGFDGGYFQRFSVWYTPL